MKLKTKKSKIILLIVILILLILVLSIVLLFLNNQPTIIDIAEEKLAYINDSEQWNDETVYPDYAAAFGRAYNGDLTIMNIGKSMYYIATEVLPTYYSDLKNATEDEIKEYYENESESIYINLAIKNEAKFEKLIYELQKLSGESIVWESYRIDLDTIDTGSNYTKAILYITYEGNEEIALNIKANNKISSDCSTVEYTISSN